MNTLGITMSIIVGIIILFIGFQVIYEHIWNQRLKSYQHKNQIKHIKSPRYILPLRRGLIAFTSVVIFGVFIVTGTFDLPKIYREKTLLNGRIAQDEASLRRKINAGNGFMFDGLFPTPDSANDDFDAGESITTPDVVGTNLQVDGVDEADIIKTDGYEIFYTPMYHGNHIYRFKVELDGSLTQLEGLTFNDTYIKEFYLTDDYLVVIGYEIAVLENYYSEADDALILPAHYFYSYRYTANIRIYDRTTLDLNYALQTHGDIRSHRLIDNTLYFVSYNSLTKDELRPSFTENVNGEVKESVVDYDSIILFDNIPAYQMITVSSLRIDTHDIKHESVVGVAGLIYMTKDALYIAGTFYYYPFLNTAITGTHIIKFNIDHEASSIHYAGSTVLEGYVFNQFWMDEYEGLLRVVTSRSWGGSDKNRLYILKENLETDKLEHVGLLDKDLGKPNEHVTSVRFDKHMAYVVTYEQKDPLYTIDLSDPKHIEIINITEEPGFNTYLHVWDDNHLVGIGYDEYFNLKISVYQTTNSADPLQTYQLSDPSDSHALWSYSEALNNHKAILISPEHGFVGFAVSKSTYLEKNGYGYVSAFYLFYIDFESEPIINEPYIIEHNETTYSNQVDRGIFINNIFYTFSSEMIVTFNGETKLISDTYILEKPNIT